MERVVHLGLFAVLFLSLVATVVGSSCYDLDVQACVVIKARTPDFCNDQQMLALTACPRFCGLCPIDCYHCNTTLADFHACNTTKRCQRGEVCMIKYLHSTVDGHKEYQLTCETKQKCDALGLAMPVGKRGLESRDLSVSCCDTDTCNYPAKETTTTSATTTPSSTTTTMKTTTKSPGCKKDVMIVVDESNSMVPYTRDLDTFLSNVFTLLPVGNDSILCTMSTFNNKATTRWSFAGIETATRSNLLQAFSTFYLNGGSGDFNVAINYADKMVNSHHNGNRRDAPDVVVIITDDSGGNVGQESTLSSRLKLKTDHVIVIGIGPVSNKEVLSVASDSNHGFHIESARYLDQLTSKLSKLICHY